MADSLHAQQFALALHLRDPQRHAPPADIEPRRLAVYRALFFDNLAQLLASHFPVLRATLGEDAWQALLRAFCAGHRARTPLFPRIGGEFVRFLQQRGEDAQQPWLAELAHYETVELEVQIDDAPLPPHDPHGDLLDGVPQLSPWLRLLRYRWPVQRIGPAWQPGEAPAQATCLLARRDADGQARFAELAPLAHALVERLRDGEHSGRALLLRLAAEHGQDPAALLHDGAALLERLRQQGSVLGTRVPA
ncbi:HvfC family RiPP maturation protein [Xanthomonas bonasiae]|uniref:HvfC family RiPP maturation protein n=1 Tax=Xanthomonas bonasiae TaxID=2810351 RepID=UPI0017841CA2|nr:putative DNA-binding domain-containing protein [Xanthomonas surreyensis]MBD7922765.1 putative DNA-binding domain-containing protein [Xanthomonas surreyensis]